MALIIVKSPYNGSEITVCQLPGEVLKVSCTKGCYEDGKKCKYHLSHYPFCKRSGEFMAEYERNKEVTE